MTRGIKIQDVTVGTGDEALRGKTVVANVRMFLNHGTELTGTFLGGQKMRIDLRKRECIAGLQYGIEGMRVGGVRSLIISPHLAYGAKGLPGHVPPNAILRCEVELLEVRESGIMKPEDYPPGKHLHVAAGPISTIPYLVCPGDTHVGKRSSGNWISRRLGFCSKTPSPCQPNSRRNACPTRNFGRT